MVPTAMAQDAILSHLFVCKLSGRGDARRGLRLVLPFSTRRNSYLCLLAQLRATAPGGLCVPAAAQQQQQRQGAQQQAHAGHHRGERWDAGGQLRPTPVDASWSRPACGPTSSPGSPGSASPPSPKVVPTRAGWPVGRRSENRAGGEGRECRRRPTQQQGHPPKPLPLAVQPRPVPAATWSRSLQEGLGRLGILVFHLPNTLGKRSPCLHEA